MSRNRAECPACRRDRWIPLANAPYCSRTCQRNAGRPMVHCVSCDQPWHPMDPAVHYRSLDHGWWCRDEFACKRRTLARRVEVAAMYRALDQVWDKLAQDGWRWPDAT